MDKKAQSAIEFVILVGVMIFFFLAFLFIIQENIVYKTKENKNLIIKEIALTVQNEISLASESSDGYHREFDIPRDILGSEYTVHVEEGFVAVSTNDGKYAISLSVDDVITGDVFTDSTNVIRKENGVVSLNMDP